MQSLPGMGPLRKLSGGGIGHHSRLPDCVSVGEVTAFDVVARVVESQDPVPGRSGSVSQDLRYLSAGVYLVKLSSDSFAAAQKLVAQR